MAAEQLQIRQGDFESFFRAPFVAYGESLPFVSQFKAELKGLFDPRHPSIRSGDLEITQFTAHSPGKPSRILGRICAHLHHPSRKHFPVPTGFFGYFDCVNDPNVARALHDQAQNWLRARGCSQISGNFNLLATQMMGVLEEGFERAPYAAMNYSGPWIPGLLSRLGYRRTFPMTTFECDLQALEDRTLVSRSDTDERFIWKKATKRNLRSDLEGLRGVMNDAFAQNPYFAPMSTEEFWHQAKDLSLVLYPEITSLVYSKTDGSLRGGVVTIPDVNQLLDRVGSKMSWRLPWELIKFKRSRDRALILFASVRREDHSCGLGWSVVAESIRQLKKKGYRKLGITWVSETNISSLKLVNRIHAQPYQRLALYERSLMPEGALP